MYRPPASKNSSFGSRLARGEKSAVLTVVTPVLLLGALFALTHPPSLPDVSQQQHAHESTFSQAAQQQHHDSAAAASTLLDNQPSIAGADAPIEGHHKPASKDDVYAVVVDAGSTGSRVHVFRFGHGVGPDGKEVLELEDDTFEAVTPGLSSYAADPKAAASSLDPLLELALSTVPEKQHSTTTLTVGATAGLRLLPGKQSDDILEAVRSHLSETYPFSVSPTAGVTVLDGQAEGAFAWLTLNYLLGHLGKPAQDTVAAIDLGGGSVQHAYALSDPKAASEAPPGYVRAMAGGGRRYSVYVHSYLGFGLMAGRSAVLKRGDAERKGPDGSSSGHRQGASEGGDDGHPCVPAVPCPSSSSTASTNPESRKEKAGGAPTEGHDQPACSLYRYGDATHDLAAAAAGSASFAQCSELARDAMSKSRPCGAPAEQCSFDGAWGGGGRPSALYVSSYFFDRAVDAGIIPEKESTISAQVKPSDLRAAGERACSAGPTASDAAAAFPAAKPDTAPFMCLDLAFQHALLTHGFGLDEQKPVTIVKKVKYRGKEVEAAWALGAALSSLEG